MIVAILSPLVRQRVKLLSKFVSIQVVVQALSLASGILLVRTLDKQEYAYFTIANTMQATMNTLADSGINSSLSSIGGKVWQDPNRFGQLINTAMQLRRYLAATAIVVVTPILLWMLISNGASITYAILITTFVLIGLSFQLTTAILSIIPKLHSQIDRIQKLDLGTNFFRLGLLCIGYFTHISAAFGILAASISIGIQNIFFRKWFSIYVNRDLSVNTEDKSTILKIIKWQAPNKVFYCVQGQITILLVGIFGDTGSIAEIGALGRISIIFYIINSVVNNIIVPTFARCQSLKKILQRYWQVIGFYCLTALLLLALTASFPRQILWVLGDRYTHLKNELLLMLCVSLLENFTRTIFSLNASKSWIKHNWISIPTTLFVQVILLIVLDISHIKGVILFSLFSQLPELSVNFYMTYIGLKESRF